VSPLNVNWVNVERWGKNDSFRAGTLFGMLETERKVSKIKAVSKPRGTLRCIQETEINKEKVHPLPMVGTVGKIDT